MLFKKILFVNGLLLPFTFAYASNSTFENISYTPRVYLSGYGGETIMGQADILAPVYFTNSNIFFAYLQSRVQNSEHSWQDTPWSASLGLGYRQIVKDKALLGGYVFGDYSHTPTDHNISVISPGLEALGKVWDARINGYFPISDKSWESGNWADYYQDYHWVRFAGHDQFDHFFANIEQTGDGVDAEVGRKLFKAYDVLVKGYVGGYFYDMQDNPDITGFSLKLTAQPKKYLTFSATDTYDETFHNTFMIGIKVRLNDLFSAKGSDTSIDENDLPQRLVDSIDRNLIANGQGSLAPTNIKLHDEGERLEQDNIWFFDEDKATPGDGTFENPYNAAQYTQSTIDNIHELDPDHALLYFDQGDFNNDIDLFINQSMFGRTEGFIAPATGDERSILEGQLTLPGNNTVDSLIIEHNPDISPITGAADPINTAINITGGNVTLSNDTVNVNGTSGTNSTGITIAENVQNTDILNSDINISQTGTATQDNSFLVTGIDMGSDSSLTLENSSVNASSNVTIADDRINIANAIGIHAAGVFDTLNVNNSSINANSNLELSNSAVTQYRETGNSYGILMGTQSLILSQPTSEAAPDPDIDLSVHDNVLNVTSSNISAKGTTTNTTENAAMDIIDSNHVNAILVGNDIVDLSLSGETYNGSVYNNNLQISDSNLSASSELNANNNVAIVPTFSFFSNGVLVGNSFFASFTGNDDISTHDNALTVHNSTISSNNSLTSQQDLTDIPSPANIQFSFISNSILVGDNFVTTSNVNLDNSIYNNIVDLSFSTLDSLNNLDFNYNNSTSPNTNTLQIGFSDISNTLVIGDNFNNSSSGNIDTSIHDNVVDTLFTTMQANAEINFNTNLDSSISALTKTDNIANNILVGTNSNTTRANTNTSIYNNLINVTTSKLDAEAVLNATNTNFNEFGNAGMMTTSNNVTIGGNFIDINSTTHTMDNSIHDNNIYIKHSSLQANSNLSLSYTNSSLNPNNVIDSSAVSNAILIGNIFENVIGPSNSAIFNNQLEIEKSNLSTSSTLTATEDSTPGFISLTNSDNSNDILIGTESASLTDSGITLDNASINNNAVSIECSSLTTAANTNSNFSFLSGGFFGNSNNILLGGNSILMSGHDSSIYQNDLSIHSSILDAQSTFDAPGLASLTAVGNASNVWVGSNILTSTLSLASIHDNTIDIAATKLIANTSFNGSRATASGNSMNVNLGYNVPSFTPEDNVQLFNNNINVSNSLLQSTSNVEATTTPGDDSNFNSYGVNVGYNTTNTPAPNNGTDIYANSINVTNSKFVIQALGETTSGSAFGISLGKNGTFDPATETQNSINAIDNIFKIGSTNSESWGIWTFNPAASPAAIINSDAAEENKFILLEGDPTKGGKILLPDGTITPWM